MRAQVGMYCYVDLEGEELVCSVECKLALLRARGAGWFASGAGKELPDRKLGGKCELPEGWESRETRGGRVFYLDHTACTTHWSLPNSAALASTSPLELQ